MASCKASAGNNPLPQKKPLEPPGRLPRKTPLPQKRPLEEPVPEEEAAAAEEAAGAAEMASKAVVRLDLSCSSLSRVFNNMKLEPVACVAWNLSAPPRAALRKCC